MSFRYPRADASPSMSSRIRPLPARMSIAGRSSSYSYGGGRHENSSGQSRLAQQRSAYAGAHRAIGLPIDHVLLDAAADHPPELLERGLEGERTEYHSRQILVRELARELLAVDPGRPHDLEGSRGASALGEVRPLEADRRPDTPWPCRGWACWGREAPREDRSRRTTAGGPSPRPEITVRRQSIPYSSFTSRAISPAVMPMPVGKGVEPDEREVARLDEVPLHQVAADGIRPVEDDHLDPVVGRRPPSRGPWSRRRCSSGSPTSWMSKTTASSPASISFVGTRVGP